MNFKHIRLIRIDEEAEDVNIDIGEVVIGRGDLFGCVDKRVSRSHGILRLTDDGDVQLISKHVNPIFYTEKGKQHTEIRSGNSVILKDGDQFSLLPDGFTFQVMISPDSAAEEKQNGYTEAVSDKVSVKEEMEETSEQIELKEEKPDVMEQRVNGSVDQCHSDVDRTRVLPSWMTGGVVEAGPSKKQKEKLKTDEVDKKKAKPAPRKRKKKADDDSDEEVAVPSRSPRKRKQVASGNGNVNKRKPHELSDDEDEEVKLPAKESSTSVPSRSPRKRKQVTSDSGDVNKTKTHELSDEGDEEVELPSQGSSRTPRKKKETGSGNESRSDPDNSADGDKMKLNDEKEDEELDAQNSKAASEEDNSDDKDEAGDQTAGNKRQRCIYGPLCYRKNPKHRIDMSHPGDVDYVDNNLPECPYGKTCYRKNQQHWLDYNHTGPAQQTNQKQKKRPRPNYKDDDSGDEDDDYDYDDPFLNDASSDDYQPTDSGSDYSAPSSGEDEDDTKRMLKEAKKFTRKKK